MCKMILYPDIMCAYLKLSDYLIMCKMILYPDIMCA